MPEPGAALAPMHAQGKTWVAIHVRVLGVVMDQAMTLVLHAFADAAQSVLGAHPGMVPSPASGGGNSIRASATVGGELVVVDIQPLAPPPSLPLPLLALPPAAPPAPARRSLRLAARGGAVAGAGPPAALQAGGGVKAAAQQARLPLAGNSTTSPPMCASPRARCDEASDRVQLSSSKAARPGCGARQLLSPGPGNGPSPAGCTSRPAWSSAAPGFATHVHIAAGAWPVASETPASSPQPQGNPADAASAAAREAPAITSGSLTGAAGSGSGSALVSLSGAKGEGVARQLIGTELLEIL